MRKCVECREILGYPSQVDICPKCWQEVFIKKIDELEPKDEKVGAADE